MRPRACYPSSDFLRAPFQVIQVLPASLGGLGLSHAECLSPAGYWVAWADALPVLQQRCPEAVERCLQAPSCRGCRHPPRRARMGPPARMGGVFAHSSREVGPASGRMVGKRMVLSHSTLLSESGSCCQPFTCRGMARRHPCRPRARPHAPRAPAPNASAPTSYTRQVWRRQSARLPRSRRRQGKPCPGVPVHWPAGSPRLCARESLDPGCEGGDRAEGRVVLQQWLANTTAPGVAADGRRRLDFVIPTSDAPIPGRLLQVGARRARGAMRRCTRRWDSSFQRPPISAARTHKRCGFSRG